MKIFIAGAGEVGFNLAEKLSNESHEVILLEKDENRINNISNQLNCLIFNGDAASITDLESAGINNSDIFVAVTDRDEVNLISCFIANDYNIPIKLARIHNDEFLDLNLDKLGINYIINTNLAVAKEVENLVKFAEAHEFITFDEGKVILFGLIIDKSNPFCNKSLMELNIYRKKYPFLIIAIQRDNDFIIPKGFDTIQEGDYIVFLTLGKYIEQIKNIFRKKSPKKEHKCIFIIGGSKIGVELAKILEKEKKYKVVLVEKDYDICLKLDEILSNTLILNIDTLDINQLKEEGLNFADITIAVTNSDELNLVFSKIAKQFGVKKTIALVRRSGISDFKDLFSVDIILSPRYITASYILKFVRRGKVISAIPIFDNKAEIIEYEITKDTLIAKKIMEVYLPENTIIGAIVRDNRAIIPSGDTMLKKNDKLIIFTKSNALKSLEEIFA